MFSRKTYKLYNGNTFMAKSVDLKKIVAGAALTACLLPTQAVYASGSPQKEKAPISVILGGRKGPESYGAGLGMRFGKIGLGVEGNLYSDIKLQDTKENIPGFEGIYFQGKENLEKTSYIGAFAEFYPRISEKLSLVIGVGGGLKKGTRNIEENLLRRETVLASNTTSTLEEDVVGNIRGGFILDITKKIGVGPFIGYEKSFKKNGLNKGGIFFGVNVFFRFPGQGGDK